MTELNMVRFYYRDESSAVHVEAGLTVVLLVQEEREHSWEIVRRRITSFMNQLEFFSFLSLITGPREASLINRRTSFMNQLEFFSSLSH